MWLLNRCLPACHCQNEWDVHVEYYSGVRTSHTMRQCGRKAETKEWWLGQLFCYFVENICKWRFTCDDLIKAIYHVQRLCQTILVTWSPPIVQWFILLFEFIHIYTDNRGERHYRVTPNTHTRTKLSSIDSLRQWHRLTRVKRRNDGRKQSETCSKGEGKTQSTITHTHEAEQIFSKLHENSINWMCFNRSLNGLCWTAAMFWISIETIELALLIAANTFGQKLFTH